MTGLYKMQTGQFKGCMGYEYSHNVTVEDTHIALFCILMIRVAYLTSKEMREIELCVASG